MADVAKGLRQWIVAPLFAGSSPVIRPYKLNTPKSSFLKHYKLYKNQQKLYIFKKKFIKSC